MSTEYRALTMLGILVKRDDLYIKRVSRLPKSILTNQCCRNADEKFDFCPKCGSALIKFETLPIGHFDDIENKFYHFDVRLCGCCVVGLLIGSCGRNGYPCQTQISRLNPDSIEKVRKQLAELLPPHLQKYMGNFGLYTLLEIT